MKFKNSILFKKSEIQTLIKTAQSVLEKYDVPVTCIKEIEISKRLKVTAGIIYYYRLSKTEFKKEYTIKLAYNNYLEFGFENIIKTFIHELAHAVCLYKYNLQGHSEQFKKICDKNGGTMNSKMAGLKYKKSSSNNFCKTKYKYEYHCRCGVIIKRKRKITKPYALACNICHCYVSDMKMIIL